MAEVTGPRPVLRLGLMVAASFTALSMIFTLVPLDALRLGAPLSTIGVLTASSTIFPLLFAVRTGTLVDRYGPRRLLIAGSIALAIAPLFAASIPSLASLFAMQIIAGLANLLTVVAGQAYTASVGSEERREANFGWYTTFVSAGQVVGPTVAGVTADAYGFRSSFLIAAVLGSIAVSSAVWLKDVRTRHDVARSEGMSVAREFRSGRRLFQSAGVQFAVAVTFAVAFAQAAFTAFFPVVLEAAGFTASLVGTLLSLRAAVSMVVRPTIPLITDFIGGQRRVLKVMLVLIAASFVAMGSDSSFIVAASVCVVVGFWWGVAPPLSIVMMVRGIDARSRGFALGVRLMGNRLAQLLGPLSIGALADVLSLRVGLVAVGAIAAGFFVTLAPSKADEELPSTEEIVE